MLPRPNTLAFVSLFGGRHGENRVKIHPQHEDTAAAVDNVEKRRPIVSFVKDTKDSKRNYNQRNYTNQYLHPLRFKYTAFESFNSQHAPHRS